MERWRLGETEERPVMPPNGGRVDELVDLSGGTQRSGVAGVERERRLRVCDSDTARERRGMILGFGGGEGRPGRGLYVAPPNGRIQRSRGATSTVLGRGGRVWGGGGGGPLVARASLVPGIGLLSCRLFSGRASGRPAVLGLRPKH
jgi:hypothetical protein